MGVWRHALNAIEQSDIVLEILDARLPAQTRQPELEHKILRRGKKLVFVLNKSDLVSKKTAFRHKQQLEKIAPAIFVSAQRKNGITSLRTFLRNVQNKKKTVIAIIGYPNTGKSTLINALCGRKAARTSSQAGFTRGRQLIRLSENQFLVDTPGIIPFTQHNGFELALIGSKNPNQLNDKEGTALQLADWIHDQNPDALKDHYGIEWKDSEQFLEELAHKKNKLRKGGKADINVMASQFILDWQKGKIKI